ncbi:3-oxoacyl-ACP synthase III family protein [Burkholderia cepacia]|uniref:3-oxoacyl-ACP synthase III family protein n=1 Tax=Burkholderia cepacia TaxID=292 RepID=UPI001CF53FB7|nr:3-oxoacyl-[acyl-carrier-protein] synthase III C-terminal domain-containing protein [Burkholderia cepacia]MCA8350734.1 hypothetical protein [Burkholderia cepacia]
MSYSIARIVSMGIHLPKRRRDVLDISRRHGIPDEVTLKTGHRRIAIAGADETPTQLAARAACIALDRAQLRGADIDTLIYCGSHKDFSKWQASTAVQQAIGNEAANCYDLYQGCNTPLLALSLASAAIQVGQARKVLIVAAECWAGCTEDHMLSQSIYVSDGAAAMVVSDTGRGIRPLHLAFRSNGQFNDLWYIRGGGHVGANKGARSGDAIYKVQRELDSAELNQFKRMAACFAADMLEECMSAAQLDKSRIDYVITLNGNDRHNEHYLKEIGCLQLENSRRYLGEIGHLGGADFIYNLNRCSEDGCVRDGGHILAYAGGAGYSWSTGIFGVEA